MDFFEDLPVLLSYHYDVTDTYWGRRQVRQHVRRIGGPPPIPELFSVAGWWLPRWLIPRRQLRTAVRRVGYDCQPPQLLRRRPFHEGMLLRRTLSSGP